MKQKNSSLQRNSPSRFSKKSESGRPSRSPQYGNRNNSKDATIGKNQRWVVGNHAIIEVLKVHPKKISRAFFQQGWESLYQQKNIFDKVKSLGIKIEEKAKGFLDQIYSHHQGSALIVEGRPELKQDDQTQFSQVLFLDGIEDPHNLGAICRTAWLMGAHGIFIPEDRAVDLTPTVHKVACGGVEHVPIIPETQFKSRVESLKEQGYWVYGLSHKATKSIFDCKYPQKIAWMIGSEDKGLRTTSEKLCDELVFIPQAAAEASYNASVATAMALFEGYRQQNYASS